MLNTPGEEDDDSLLDLELTRTGEPILPPPAPTSTDSGASDGSEDDCMPLDDEREQVGFELFDWQADELDALDDELHEVAIAHEWVSDGLEVVVHLDDEALVESLLGKVRYPDELSPEPDVGDTDMEVLGQLFVAADRLRKDPTGDGVTKFLDAAERVDDAPYGVDPRLWEVVVEAVDGLVDAFHAAAPIEDIVEQATRLRDGLRPLV